MKSIMSSIRTQIKRRTQTVESTMTLTPDAGTKLRSTGPIKVDALIGDWGFQLGFPIMKVLGSALNFSWTQGASQFARMQIIAFSPMDQGLGIASMSINGQSKRTFNVKSEMYGRTVINLDLAPVTELKAANTASLLFVKGTGFLYIQEVKIELLAMDNLQNVSETYQVIQKDTYESTVKFVNSMKGTRTIIEGIKGELEGHQLRTRIAKTTGASIMIAGAIGAWFTFGVSAVVAGAVGGAIGVGTDITDWVVSDQQGKKIQSAMNDLKEFQFDFQTKYDSMQKFTMAMSQKFNVDVPMFMAVMNNIKRGASDAKQVYGTFNSFNQTYAMFQALKSGQSIQHVGTTFANAADMQMMVGRVGMNLGKEVGTLTKFSVWIGETTGELSSFLGKVAPIFNVVDIVMTWMIQNPKIDDAQKAIDQLNAGIPQLEGFAEDIKPVGKRNLIRALNMAPERVSQKTMRRLKIVLTKRNTMSAKSAAREVRLAVRTAGKVF